MDDNTTYRLSYWEGPSTITEPIPPRDCLVTGDCEMAHDTTYKSSYLDYKCVEPVTSIIPCEKQWLGRGPMQDVTTQKHDYTWKSIKTRQAYKALDNIFCHPAPLRDDTTYKLSYYETCCRTPAESFAPIRRYIKSDIPLENETIYKLSYWPHDPTGIKDEPWSKKQEYTPPTEPLEGCTTYKLSYYPHSQEKPSLIIPPPTENILNAGCCSDKNTTYRLSYFGAQDGRRDPIVPSGNITFSTCPPAYDTINKMSFLGNWNVKPEEPITPCSKQMLGRGLMQDVTTQKHDFTWKRIEVEPGVRPRDNLIPACAPVECCTTHRMSYIPTDCKSPVESYAPIRVYAPSDIPMDAETIMRLSYQPVGPSYQTEKSYSKTCVYQPPNTPIDDHTTYNLSYIPPGMLAPCCMEKPKPCIAAAQCCS
nr:PREDICTED: protein FAM154A-like [Megachile rotundata]